MNPDTNRFERLIVSKDLPPLPDDADPTLFRPDGSRVPKHWTIFTLGECVVVKEHTFRIAYIGETAMLLEPVGPEIPFREIPV